MKKRRSTRGRKACEIAEKKALPWKEEKKRKYRKPF